jgi:protein phosphatase
MSGKNNEDRYAVSAYQLSGQDATPAVLAVLCDGIGGHRAGEVAAEMAVDTITQVVASSEGERPVDTLRAAVVAASQEIYAQAQTDLSRLGMGATCACAWVIGERLYLATVGDSRIYLLRGGQIQQLTVDHTWVQEALESGALRPDEVRGHPNAHVIRRFLGSPNPPDVDFRLRLLGSESYTEAEANQGLVLRPGDRVLLCSDGLTDLVNPPEILSTLGPAGRSPENAVQSLIDQANARGGHDNITVVVLGVPLPGKTVEPRAAAAKPRRRWGWYALGCIGMVMLALAVAFAAFGLGALLGIPSGAPTPTPTLPASLQTVFPQGKTPLPGLLPVEPSGTPFGGYPAPRPEVTPTPLPPTAAPPPEVPTAIPTVV